MKFRYLLPTIVACSATAALAHHSGAMFDASKTVTVSGVIKRYAFTNPHTWIDVEVTAPNGKRTIWSVEGGAPASMKRAGITPGTLKMGDKVTIAMSPLRDGRQGGSLRTVTLANGKTIAAATYRTDVLSAPKATSERPSF